MNSENVTFTVFRFNPEKDKEPHYEEYAIETRKGMTILDGLRKIKDEIDGSLALRYSCSSAICGSCSMKINRYSKLACKTQVTDQMKLHGKILVEPMANLRAIKDLVVDMEPFWNHWNNLKPWLIKDPKKPEPAREHTMTRDQVTAFGNTPSCITCAACFSECPAYEVDHNFPGPAALSRLYRFAIDPRDGAQKERLEMAGSIDTWLCVRCGLCVEACPKDVKPGEVITLLKEKSVKAGHVQNIGAHHAESFRENIEEFGNLNEGKLVFDTLGVGGALKKSPDAIKLLLRGKKVDKLLGDLKQKPIPGIEQVKQIYREMKKKK